MGFHVATVAETLRPCHSQGMSVRHWELLPSVDTDELLSQRCQEGVGGGRGPHCASFGLHLPHLKNESKG